MYQTLLPANKTHIRQNNRILFPLVHICPPHDEPHAGAFHHIPLRLIPLRLFAKDLGKLHHRLHFPVVFHTKLRPSHQKLRAAYHLADKYQNFCLSAPQTCCHDNILRHVIINNLRLLYRILFYFAIFSL